MEYYDTHEIWLGFPLFFHRISDSFWESNAEPSVAM